MTELDSKLKTGRQTAILLVGATLLYNMAEGVIAVWSGSEVGSIALVGFGIDSVIEVSASAVVLWHLLKVFGGVSECELESRERFARRFIGITFLALAAYVGVQAGMNLWFRQAPEESWIGIILAILSILVMPILARRKLEVAKAIGSEALELEAKETLCCFYLSVILLMGLLLNALYGWWWADPVGGLVMTPWLVQEGLEGIKGEPGCCDH